MKEGENSGNGAGWGWGAGKDNGTTGELQMKRGDIATRDYENSPIRLKPLSLSPRLTQICK